MIKKDLEPIKITIRPGSGLNWFVIINDRLIASFIDKKDADFFCECKYPNVEIK